MNDFSTLNELPLQQRIGFFHDLMNCENRIDFWIYGTDFRLIRSSTDKVALNTVFEHTGCMEYMKQYFIDSDKPLILSSFLGLMWCAVRSTAEDGGASMYVVMGPVFNAEVSLGVLREAADRYHVNENWRDGFISLLHGLSTIPASMFFHFALWLEYAVSGRRLAMSEVSFQHSATFDDGDSTRFMVNQEVASDRLATYYIEKKLLDNVRTGNSNYETDFLNARKLSNGIRISTRDPISQAILSCTSFITLCTRAAIEGGLAPDTAYSIGDGYIQIVTGCTNITELRSITHRMYEHFVTAVKDRQSAVLYSRQVQSCVDYIENHIYEDIQLSDLAAHAGYTDYYLSRKFKEETGMSVRRFIMQKKLEQGAELLCSSTDSINAIAEKLHFCSSSYFSSRFREHYNVLPQKYRDDNQKL